MQKLNKIWIGIAVGLLIPLTIATVYYSSTYLIYLPLKDGLKILSGNTALMSRMAMLSLLPNAATVFLSYKLWLWDTFKGIMTTTVFLLVPVMFFLV